MSRGSRSVPSFHGTSPSFFFFNDTATTEIYTLSLHDALPISSSFHVIGEIFDRVYEGASLGTPPLTGVRSEEHTSELQSLRHLVCRLLLVKKKSTEILCISSGSTSVIRIVSTADAMTRIRQYR